MKIILKAGKLTRSTTHSVGYDLHSTKDVLLDPGEQTLVSTGVITHMEGAFALILDRSGLAAKHRVTRRAGVIDGDYDQEWGVVLVNEGKEPYQVRVGDKIAQCIFYPQVPIPFEMQGGELEEKIEERGGGFGSTGK